MGPRSGRRRQLLGAARFGGAWRVSPRWAAMSDPAGATNGRAGATRRGCTLGDGPRGSGALAARPLRGLADRDQHAGRLARPSQSVTRAQVVDQLIWPWTRMSAP